MWKRLPQDRSAELERRQLHCQGLVTMGKFLCPRCQRLHQESDARIGEVIICTGCQVRVRVPARRNNLRDFPQQSNSSKTRGREDDGATYRLASPPVPLFSSPAGKSHNWDDSDGQIRNPKQRHRLLTGLMALALLAATATGTVFYFDKTDEVSGWIAEAKTWIEKAIDRNSSSLTTRSPAVSDSISENELTSYFNWTPPDGWQKGNMQTRVRGENVLNFDATTAELPTVEVKFHFKRDDISEAAFWNQLKKSANDNPETPTWLPERQIGLRTLYTSEFAGKDDRSYRNYHWFVTEKSVQCSICISGTPEELEQAITGLEASFEAAIATQQESKPLLESEPIHPKQERNEQTQFNDGATR